MHNPFAEKNIFQLPVLGQGIFTFSNNEYCYPSSEHQEFSIIKFLNSSFDDGLEFIFNQNTISCNRTSNSEIFVDPTNNQGLCNHISAFYWISIDYNNLCIKAGLGEPRLETQEYTFQFEEQYKSFLRSLFYVFPEENVQPLKLIKDPITTNIPLLVKNMNDFTMNDIAENKYLPKANLSLQAQILYESIAGKRFLLNDESFPEFSKAIQYSIVTEGCWCNKKLIEKSGEFSSGSPNINETYLRITLGQNNGESPGIPFVMEIWPVGHYSPIHSHASTHAIIRVLHGSIEVELYPFLCSGKNSIQPFATTDFHKNDVTWISPELNQVHRLTNPDTNKDPCITIQCYIYGKKNREHYDYFDFINDKGETEQYTPDSDMEFIAFKQLMKDEWENRQKKFMCGF